MTNEELKKKIVDILVNCKSDECAIEYCSECDGNPCIENCREKQQADALIAAGIVDKSDYASMKETAVRYKAEVSKAEARAKEAELRAEVAESELERYTGLIKPLEVENARLNHRAARAERALKNFAENITCEDCPFFSDCASSEKMEDLIHSNYCFAEYLRQAEKELAEEGK